MIDAPTDSAPAERADEPARGRPSPAPALSLVDVTKRFGDVAAVDAVTLSVPEGELVTLLGPSGCGKTTLLRIVAGFERPTEGRVLIGRDDITGAPPERRPVNLVFQRWALFPHKNVLENVLFGLEAARVPRREARERALDALRLCRMDGFTGRKIQELSGGQAQRVAVARALVNRPQLLLLDEPLSALDLKLRRHLQVELRRLQQELGMTFLYVTHDQEEALALSDAIVVMQDGRVVQHSTPRELFDEPRTLFAATFIGDANVLPGTIARLDGERADVVVGRITLHGRCRQALAAGAPARLCLRPSQVRVGAGEIAATVVDVVFAGSSVRYWLRLTPDVTIVADSPIKPGEPLLEIGAEATVDWDPDAVFVFPA
jgi:spermidine/putrescine transport system ATP-binding protein